MYMQVALNKTSQEPPFRKQIFRLLSRSHKGCIFQNPEFVSGIKYIKSNKREWQYHQTTWSDSMAGSISSFPYLHEFIIE